MLSHHGQRLLANTWALYIHMYIGLAQLQYNSTIAQSGAIMREQLCRCFAYTCFNSCAIVTLLASDRVPKCNAIEVTNIPQSGDNDLKIALIVDPVREVNRFRRFAVCVRQCSDNGNEVTPEHYFALPLFPVSTMYF
jgi:hypothetical protein